MNKFSLYLIVAALFCSPAFAQSAEEEQYTKEQLEKMAKDAYNLGYQVGFTDGLKNGGGGGGGGGGSIAEIKPFFSSIVSGASSGGIIVGGPAGGGSRGYEIALDALTRGVKVASSESPEEDTAKDKQAVQQALLKGEKIRLEGYFFTQGMIRYGKTTLDKMDLSSNSEIISLSRAPLRQMWTEEPSEIAPQAIAEILELQKSGIQEGLLITRATIEK